MSDTPRMKAAQMAAIEHGTGDVYRVGCDIERELSAANVEIERLTKKVAQLYEGAEEQKQRIKRLEAGDAALNYSIGLDLQNENDALKKRIKRLEEAGDEMAQGCVNSSRLAYHWCKAKEAKL